MTSEIFEIALKILIPILTAIAIRFAYKWGFQEGIKKAKEKEKTTQNQPVKINLCDAINKLGADGIILQSRLNVATKQFNLGLIDFLEFDRIKKEIEKEILSK